MKIAFVALLSLAALAAADIYVNHPPSGNNRCNEAANNIDNNNRVCNTQSNSAGAYHYVPPLIVYEGSQLMFEWTVQHESGGEITDTDLIFQYMCEIDSPGLRECDPTQGDAARQTITEATAGDPNLAKWERVETFQACNARERNKGLFNADQNVNNNNGCQCTMQNAGGTVYGFESQEERDYYPYWHPSEWRDWGILTTNVTRCQMYQDESQNVKNKGLCSAAEHNNRGACEGAGATWTETGRFGIDPPSCGPSPYSMPNQLGNSVDGFEQNWNATIPAVTTNEQDDVRCFGRVRYNMTTKGVGPDIYNFDAGLNGAGVSPLENDPVNTVGGLDFNIAFNTAQCIRCFEGRTWELLVRRRTVDVAGCSGIKNVNQRGQRGNIDQTYPATEYDFVPSHAQVDVGECMHMQFVFTDYDPDNRAGANPSPVSRGNACQSNGNIRGNNYPAHIDEVDMWDANANGDQQSQIITDACYHDSSGGSVADGSAHNDVGVTVHRNNGSYNYMSTRNNAFSNRSQKGALVVGNNLSIAMILLIVLASLMLMAGIGFGGSYVYATKNPDSQVASWFHKHNMARPGSYSRR